MNGRSAASTAVFNSNRFQIDGIDSVTNHAQIFEGACVGELLNIIKGRGQIVGVRVEAHHIRLLCIDSETFFMRTLLVCLAWSACG